MISQRKSRVTFVILVWEGEVLPTASFRIRSLSFGFCSLALICSQIIKALFVLVFVRLLHFLALWVDVYRLWDSQPWLLRSSVIHSFCRCPEVLDYSSFSFLAVSHCVLIFRVSPGNLSGLLILSSAVSVGWWAHQRQFSALRLWFPEFPLESWVSVSPYVTHMFPHGLYFFFQIKLFVTES